MDDITRNICDITFQKLNECNEIELKIGKLRDTKTNNKPFIPIKSEAIIHRYNYNNYNHSNLNFDSEISEDSFNALKECLNLQMEIVNSKDAYQGPKVQYIHYVEDDLVYSNGNDGRLRVTMVNNSVKRIIQKNRIENLDILSPNTIHDYRFSLNMESDLSVDTSKLNQPFNIRNKDRRSYTFGPFTIDMTRVTEYTIESNSSNTPSRIIHVFDKTLKLRETAIKYELEMEIKCESLREYAQKLEINPKSQSFTSTMKDALAFIRACIYTCDQAVRDPNYKSHLSRELEQLKKTQQRSNQNYIQQDSKPPLKDIYKDQKPQTNTTNATNVTNTINASTTGTTNISNSTNSPNKILEDSSSPKSIDAKGKPNFENNSPNQKLESLMPPPNILPRKRKLGE